MLQGEGQRLVVDRNFVRWGTAEITEPVDCVSHIFRAGARNDQSSRACTCIGSVGITNAAPGTAEVATQPLGVTADDHAIAPVARRQNACNVHRGSYALSVLNRINRRVAKQLDLFAHVSDSAVDGGRARHRLIIHRNNIDQARATLAYACAA